MSLSRPSWRAVASVLSAAALVAAGAGSLSYAGSGHSSPRAGDTTVIKNTGKGPALSLISKKKFPALAVSNSKLVKKLNADALDGRHAEQLSPTIMRATVGTPNQPITGNQYFTSTAIPAGTYVASMHGLMSPDSGANYQCLFIDYTKFAAMDYSGYWAVAFRSDSSEDLNIDQSNVVTLPAGHQVIWGCSFSGNTTVLQPAAFTLQKTTKTVPMTGSVFTQRPGARKLLAGLR